MSIEAVSVSIFVLFVDDSFEVSFTSRWGEPVLVVEVTANSFENSVDEWVSFDGAFVVFRVVMGGDITESILGSSIGSVRTPSWNELSSPERITQLTLKPSNWIVSMPLSFSHRKYVVDSDKFDIRSVISVSFNDSNALTSIFSLNEFALSVIVFNCGILMNEASGILARLQLSKLRTSNVRWTKKPDSDSGSSMKFPLRSSRFKFISSSKVEGSKKVNLFDAKMRTSRTLNPSRFLAVMFESWLCDRSRIRS